MIKNILGSMNTQFGRCLISVILGIGFSSIFRKTCSNTNCLVFKAPHHDDISKNIYRHNDDCYKFTAKSISCKTRSKQIDYA